MNIIILNGSPKPNGGTSAILTDHLKKAMTRDKQDINYTILNIRSNMIPESDYSLFNTCDALVIACPLYFDSFPSHLLLQLEKLEAWFNSKKGEKSPAKGKMVVYGLVNNGLYEGRQCELSLQMLHAWSMKCGFIWGQGIGIGGGEMIGMLTAVPFGHGPLRSAGKAVNFLAANILQLKKSEDIFSSPDYPRFIFINNANNLMWEKRAKEHGLTHKQLLYRIP